MEIGLAIFLSIVVTSTVMAIVLIVISKSSRNDGVIYPSTAIDKNNNIFEQSKQDNLKTLRLEHPDAPLFSSKAELDHYIEEYINTVLDEYFSKIMPDLRNQGKYVNDCLRKTSFFTDLCYYRLTINIRSENKQDDSISSVETTPISNEFETVK